MVCAGSLPLSGFRGSREASSCRTTPLESLSRFSQDVVRAALVDVVSKALSALAIALVGLAALLEGRFKPRRLRRCAGGARPGEACRGRSAR
jgi:hypothetical protein